MVFLKCVVDAEEGRERIAQTFHGLRLVHAYVSVRRSRSLDLLRRALTSAGRILRPFHLTFAILSLPSSAFQRISRRDGDVWGTVLVREKVNVEF